jgi:CubicO group peptidase (beta-lactamase class C family)
MKKYFLSAFALYCAFAQAQITSAELDEVAKRALTTFNVPGIAIAIVKDGKVIHSQGYGVRSVVSKQPVNEHTLFGIASNSKAFTASALAMLADEGKLTWDDKVVKYIPDFKMYNDYVTNEFTIRDLLTHRSGLGLGAGDLMIWPGGSDFTKEDIIHNLRYLKPVSAFRTKFDYDNLLYMVAGEIIEKVSGKSWTDFVEQRIMQPLQMNNSAGTYVTLKDTSNIVMPHVPIDSNLKVISRYKDRTLDAAGGIYSSVADVSKWMLMQLNKGQYGATPTQLFSKKQHAEMWQMQTIIPTSTRPPYNTHFSGYGLGWFVADVKGQLQVSHTGGLEGMVTQVTLLPEMNLGIVVLTNQQSGAAFTAITNTIKDSYLGIPATDYVKLYGEREKAGGSNADKITDEIWTAVNKNLKGYQINRKLIGTYNDLWLGEVNITEKNGKLYFGSKRSPQLTGEMFYYKDNNYVVKWNNRALHADAHIFFDESLNGFTMKPISPLTDFSYDFQDLNFSRK